MTKYLTLSRRFLSDKLTGLPKSKNFPHFMEWKRFLLWVEEAAIFPSFSQPTTLRSILILYSHWRQSFPIVSSLTDLPTKTLHVFLLPPLFDRCPCHIILLHLTTHIYTYLHPLRSKHLHQHPQTLVFP
jgi:hypothetical protein